MLRTAGWRVLSVAGPTHHLMGTARHQDGRQVTVEAATVLGCVRGAVAGDTGDGLVTKAKRMPGRKGDETEAAAILWAARSNQPLLAMAVEAARVDLERGTADWPTLRELKREYARSRPT